MTIDASLPSGLDEVELGATQSKRARIAAQSHPGQMTTDAPPADPLFTHQWHLLDAPRSTDDRPQIDIHVVEAWKSYTGKGVKIGIWDDGVQYTHPDLAANYDPKLAITVDGTRHDPAPQSSQSEHGTSVAGLIVAGANNGIGTVGVAYGAKFGAVDVFYNSSLDKPAAFNRLDRFDVNNHSWGFSAAYDANQLDPSWHDFFAAWQRSVRVGRDGLGSINVVAVGNDRADGRHSNDSNMSNIPQVIVVGAVSKDGMVAQYSTPGSSLLVVAPSNGVAGSGIWTTDRTGKAGYSDGLNEAPTNTNPNYTAKFGGTSAATPEVSGVAALMLQANPDLGWRDVQTILAMTARHVGSEIGAGPHGTELNRWFFNDAKTWNGGGLHFSNDYGFGLVDALAAVRVAEYWNQQQTSANWDRVLAGTWSGHRAVPDNNPRGISVAIKTTDAVQLEHVGLQLDLENSLTGDLRVTLTSPSGTTSVVAVEHDLGGSVTEGWIFTSNAFRGEDSVGTWTVRVSDHWIGDEGILVHAKLRFYGAAEGDDRTYVFTDEYSDYAGSKGHSRWIGDRDGSDTINAAAVGSATRIDLARGTGVIDGVAVHVRTGVQDVTAGDKADRLFGDGGANLLIGGRGDDLLRGRGGDDRLSGGQGNDDLAGGAGDDRLYGRFGQDTLSGGSGDDRIWGGTGVDWLRDGAGRDILTGGSGADVFDFERDGSLDRIRDFHEGEDHIRLAGLHFKDLTITDLQPGRVSVAYAGEVLEIEDGGAGRLHAADLTKGDFFFW